MRGVKINIFKSLFLVFFSLPIFMMCFPPPELPDEPKISLSNISFVPLADGFNDSIKVTVRFEDGNGDLGLTGNEDDHPYNRFYYFDDGNGGRLNINSNDTMPPYTCETYKLDTFRVDGVLQGDTNYIRYNDRHWNFLMDMYVKENGEFEFYNFTTDPNCPPGFVGRFPILNTSGKERALEGEILYEVVAGLRLPFRKDTVKFKVAIYDRTGNLSNTVESGEFKIDDLITPI